MEMSKREILELQEAAWDEGMEDLKHDLLQPLHYHPESTGTENPYSRRLRALEENPQPRKVRGDDRVREALELVSVLRDRHSDELRDLTSSSEVLDSLDAVLKMGLREHRGDFDVTPATLIAAAVNHWSKRNC